MVNWDRIDELRTEVLGEDFAEVFGVFLEEVEECLTKLKDQNSTDSIEECLHFLKGAAINVGFDEFADVCRASEHDCTECNKPEIDIQNLVNSFEASLVVLNERAAELGLAA